MNSLTSRFAPVDQAQNASTTHQQRIGLGALGFYCIGLGLLLSATYLAALNGLEKSGSDTAHIVVNVGQPILFALILAFAMPVVHRFMMDRKFGLAFAASLLLAFSAAMNVPSALGSIAGQSWKMQAAEDGVEESRARVQAQYDGATTKLSALPFTRPATVIQAEIERLEGTPGAECHLDPSDSRYGPISKRVCRLVENAKLELANAGERAKAEASKAQAIALLNSKSQAPQPIANTDAKALVQLSAVFGFELAAEKVSLTLAVLRTLALEIGAGLCFTIAGNLRKSPVGKGVPNSVPATNGGALKEIGASEGDLRDTGEDEGGSGPQLASTGHPLITYLKTQGGVVENVGQRSLAKAVGVSKSEANRMLQDLAMSGAIAFQADKMKGTSVRLLAV